MKDYLKPAAELVEFDLLNPNASGEGGSESSGFDEGDFA